MRDRLHKNEITTASSNFLFFLLYTEIKTKYLWRIECVIVAIPTNCPTELNIQEQNETKIKIKCFLFSVFSFHIFFILSLNIVHQRIIYSSSSPKKKGWNVCCGYEFGEMLKFKYTLITNLCLPSYFMIPRPPNCSKNYLYTTLYDIMLLWYDGFIMFSFKPTYVIKRCFWRTKYSDGTSNLLSLLKQRKIY